jgi:hypothetical protein
MWSWRRMEISWTNHVKNEEILHEVKEGRNILPKKKKKKKTLHMTKQRKANCIIHILCRNCLLKHVIEGKIEGTIQQGRRHKQLLDNLKEMRR